MDRQQMADVRQEVRERIRAGTKRKARFPSHIFIEFGIDELDMLRDNYTAHMKFMEHVETWRIGILNAVSDGASLSTISMLFSPDTAAQCLDAAGIDTAGIRGAMLRENGIPCYGAPFYDTVEAADGTYDTVEDADLLWCGVTKKYYDRSAVRAAHIIPANTAHGTIQHSFGEPHSQAILNSLRNSIMMHHNLEQAFDKGQITIVPMAEASTSTSAEGGTLPEPTEYRLFPIDRSLACNRQTAVRISGDELVYWSDLAQKPQLEFRNENRPGQGNLFWHCLINFTKAKCQGHIGLTDALEEFEKQVVWDKPGKWIEQSMLANMASQAMTPQLFRADATFIDDGELGKTAKELAKLATCGLSKLPESKVSSSLDSDEESDDEKSDLEGMIHPSFVPEQYYSPLPALPLDPPACCT
ncbi:hypothetical protein ABEF93_008647 [Exophiala dermatitidis]